MQGIYTHIPETNYVTVFPRDIVCLRNMSINTLHKGDDDDDVMMMMIMMVMMIIIIIIIIIIRQFIN